MNTEIEKLEKALRAMKKPSIDMHTKMRIRGDVLKQITKYKENPVFFSKHALGLWTWSKMNEIMR